MTFSFFSNHTATTDIYTLSLHDALPISALRIASHNQNMDADLRQFLGCRARSEEHTSELQSRGHLVCRLLLEKKKNLHRYRRNRSAIAHYHDSKNRLEEPCCSDAYLDYH